ncbi:MAG: ATP-dependent 6-phosphofructokinase [Sedimentisphaerales bacterium]|nr:ATP-dependent 6-phosphofructokinase [Sedimentisphaerales bacterium]
MTDRYNLKHNPNMDADFLKPEELNDLTIDKLGTPTYESPLAQNRCHFTEDNEKISLYSHSDHLKAYQDFPDKLPMLEYAGPRRRIFFKPENINCGIVTCGGLCPGLNDVIRILTLNLFWQYGVKKIYGFRYGYLGMSSKAPMPAVLLTPELVEDIHQRGGDILSTSRGPQDIDDMVNTLEKMEIAILFVIGGDGTLHGARELVRVIQKRQLKISIIGIPKTIDNDISGIEQSFGFSTAVEATRAAILSAHEEAKGAWNGVGLVKLMGRDSGFIAAHATLANSDVNFCFVPEVPFRLEGVNGFLNTLEERLNRKHHAVIVVAEGLAQQLSQDKGTIRKDASGNVIFDDIGLILKDIIKKHFNSRQIPISLKYIDPSYMIRSLPADSNDSAFCVMLGQNAAHAGMSGRTNMVVGYCNQHFVHLPIDLTIKERKKIDPNGHLWQTVIETTGQKC